MARAQLEPTATLKEKAGARRDFAGHTTKRGSLAVNLLARGAPFLMLVAGERLLSAQHVA